MYSLHPHIVLQTRPSDGAARRRWTTSSPIFSQVSRAGLRLHGSGTASLHPGGYGYYALAHTLDDDNAYNTLLYK